MKTINMKNENKFKTYKIISNRFESIGFYEDFKIDIGENILSKNKKLFEELIKLFPNDFEEIKSDENVKNNNIRMEFVQKCTDELHNSIKNIIEHFGNITQYAITSIKILSKITDKNKLVICDITIDMEDFLNIKILDL